MTDLNHVVLIGRLTRNISDNERDFGYHGTQARASISIAVNRSTRKEDGSWTDEANYFDVTIWGKQAEALKPYLLKGKQIAIDGYLKQDRWEKDGQKFSRVVIVATSAQLLGGKSEGGQTSGGAPRLQPNESNQSLPSYTSNYGGNSFGDTGSDFPEDIPF